jgi:hypothetical protein
MGMVRRRFSVSELRSLYPFVFVFEILVALFGVAFAFLSFAYFWRRMRPRLVITILILIQLFFVWIAFSPSVGFSMQSIIATREWRENPNPETERRMRIENNWDVWRPRFVWMVIVINGSLAVIYGAKLMRGRTAH